MKNLLFLSVLYLLFFSSTSTLNAQTVQWAKTGISEGFENGNAICTDDSGNVYVTGQIEFTSVFDNVVLRSYGQHDIFVAKYNTQGNLLWIRQAGGPGGDIGNGIGIDAMHNVYVTGEFEDSARFGNITRYTSGGNDGFLAKYDVNGNIVWARDFGCPTSSDKGRALAVSPSGNVYITGNFSVTGTFSGLTLNANGANDIFVVKYDTNGDIQWAKKAGGSKQDRGYGLTIDANENIYVAGTFTASATFSGTTITNAGNHSTFLAKYNSSGNFQWVKEAGACCDTTKANAVALDENGNIYVTGYFMDSTQFGSFGFNGIGNDTLPDAYLVKYDPLGNVVWARQAGGPDEDAAYGVVVDTLNHLIYTTGLVRAQGNFGNLPFAIVGYKDVFVAAYDMNGNEVWVKTYGGHYRDAGAAITVDPKGYIYSTGLFNDVAQFGSFTLTGYPNQPWADFYVDKISPAMAAMPTLEASNLLMTNSQCSDIQLNFTIGNGHRRIIIAHEGSAVNAFPVNGNNYTASNSFGNGSNLGNNNFVVYNGTGNNVTVTNLHPGSIYYFSVFEYNGFGIASSYMMTTNAHGNATARIFPVNINSSMPSTICEGHTAELTASGAASYTWSPSGSLSASYDAIVTASPLSTTTYTVTGLTSDGCYAEGTYTITVSPMPVVSFASMNPVCINSTPIMLSGGSPAGGIYSGNGVAAGIFDPSTTGSGTFAISYQYTDLNGCTAISGTDMTVNPLPALTFTSLPDMCSNESPTTLTNCSPAGGTYSGTGVSAGIFDPSVGAGTYQINYSYTDINGCSNSTSGNVLVNAAPVVNLGNDLIVCASNTAQLTATAGMSAYLWSTGETTPSVTVDSSGTGLGIKNVYVIVTNASGCKANDIIQVRFDLCAGINSANTINDEFLYYPSPFKSTLNIHSEKIVSFYLYDVCGRLLDKNENFFGKFTTGENLPSGIYFLEVISGTNKKVISVIKSE